MEKRQMRKIFSRVGLGIFLWMLIQQVGSVVLTFVLAFVAPDVLDSSWIYWLLAYIPLYCFGLPVLLAVLRTIPTYTGGPEEKRKLSPKNLLTINAACWAIALVVNLLMYALADVIESIKGSEVVNLLEDAMSGSNAWINFVIVALVAPVAEEFVFRKKLYDKLIVFGGGTYIVISSMLFALFHVNFYQLLYAFLLGMVFATVTYYTGTIRYTVIAHMIHNCLGGGLTGLIELYGGEAAVIVWGLLLYVIAIVGVVIVIWWLVKRRHTITFAEPEVALPGKGVIFLNPGMLICLVSFAGLILFTLLM